MKHGSPRARRTPRTGRLLGALAVAALGVATLVVPATHASAVSPCTVGSVNPNVNAAYQFAGSTQNNPFNLIFDADGNTNTVGDQTIVGTGTYGVPALGQITVAITGNHADASYTYVYQVAVCLQGLNQNVQTGWLNDGGTTGAPIAFPASGYPTYAYVVREIKTPKAGGQWCSPGFWKNNYGAWGPTGYTPSSIDIVTGKTFGEILSNPQTYAKTGDYERIADILSGAHPLISFDGNRNENCPLPADEASKPKKK